MDFESDYKQSTPAKEYIQRKNSIMQNPPQGLFGKAMTGVGDVWSRMKLGSAYFGRPETLQTNYSGEQSIDPGDAAVRLVELYQANPNKYQGLWNKALNGSIYMQLPLSDEKEKFFQPPNR